MDEHPTIEATAVLDDLLALASSGPSVILTRGGMPVAELRALPSGTVPTAPPNGAGDIAWLRRHRVGIPDPGRLDAGEFVSRMRDEDWR